MERRIYKTFHVISFFSLILLLSFVISNNDAKAENVQNNPLLEGIKIEGPDYIYEFEGTAEFCLNKEGYQSSKHHYENLEEDEKYDLLSFEWKSSNDEVAKYSHVLYAEPSEDCVREIYPVLRRPNIFNIKRGNAVITCKISDNEGNSVIVSKQLHVLKGKPIKSLTIGGHKLKKYQLKTNSSYLFTNELKKNTKIKIDLEKNWNVDKLTVDPQYSKKRGYYEKNITKKKEFSMKRMGDYHIRLTLVNQKTGQIFHYICRIARYDKYKIKLGKLKKGIYVVAKFESPPPVFGYYAKALKYKKNSKKSDRDSFKSAKDLVWKLKKYYNYTSQTVKYKNGKITLKETLWLSRWELCKSKKQLKRKVKEMLKDESDYY